MSKLLESVIESWDGRPIDKNYFIGDSRFSISAKDYSLKGINTKSETYRHPQKVPFKPDYTAYGIMVEVPKKGKLIDVVIIGFNSQEDVLDCLQIQGARGSYRELKPLRWDRALLNSTKILAKESELDAVLLVPAHLVEGWNWINSERLQLRYNINAESQNFKYSDSMERYVLDLKKV